MWIERTAGDTIQQAGTAFPMLIIHGVRKSGKTALLERLFPWADHVSLDTPAALLQISDDPQRFLEQLDSPCILDQLQAAPAVLNALNRHISQFSSEKPWILVATHLTEYMHTCIQQFTVPYKICTLNTLSAQELRSTWISSKERVHYCWKGGYPELWAEENPNISKFFDSYIQEFLERDLKKFVQVKNSLEFQRVLQLCAESAGNSVNYTEISEKSGVTANTVKAWIKSLHAAGLIRLLPCSPRPTGKRLTKAPKLYFSDTGFLCYLLGINGKKELESHRLKETIWKHVVFGELAKNGNWHPGTNMFYYRDQNGVEIDFLLDSDNTIRLIRSSWSTIQETEHSAFSTVQKAFRSRSARCLAAVCETSPPAHVQGIKVYNPLFQDQELD